MIDSNGFMQTLAWSLLHFLWQGAAIAALAAAVMYVFRAPSVRYLAGVVALVLMIAAFGVTFAMLNGAAEGTALLAAQDAVAPGRASEPNTAAAPTTTLPMLAPAIADSDAAYLWIARIWLVGVCVLALRVAFGLLLLEHLRRRNLVPLPEELVAKFRALQEKLGITRVVRYCECRQVNAPAVIGFIRPIVLLPMRALTGLSEAQLAAVIAHELGHIKRFDVAVNFLQVIAETLFFFHPAVWWLNNRIRADREDCCDDIAVAASGESVGYARALATMTGWRDAPAFAMAATGGPVATRIARLLGVSKGETGTRHAGVFTATLVLTAALVAGAVSLGVAKPALAAAGSLANGVVAQASQPTSLPEPVTPPVPASSVPVPTPVAQAVPAAKPAAKPKPVQAAPANTFNTSGRSGPSYIDELKSVGIDNLDVDKLIALKVHGVTPEYVRGIRASGLNPDIDQLLAMRVHDVSPEYVKQMSGLGIEADLEKVIAMKVHDIDVQYVNEIRELEENVTVDEIIGMKVHGVTPEYRRMLEANGFKVDLEDVVHAKVMDITPEFIAKARSHGFKDLDLDKLIHLKNADVL